MNELFVNVKVDREERPDVDAVYMDAVQAMTGHGGWPMTVFLTPDGRPFFGGTYFPKPSRSCQLDWRADRRRVAHRRDELLDAGRPAHRGARPDRTASSRGDRACPASTHLNARAAAAGRRSSTRVGRLRRRRPSSRQTMSLELLLRAPRWPAPATSALPGRHDDARRHGLRRHLRPPRRRLRPLLGRRALAGAPLREDALRPGAAGPRLPARLAGHRRARYRQVLEETIGYVLARPAPPGGGLLLGRGRRLARARRAASTSGPRRGRAPRVGADAAPAAARLVRRDRGRQLRGPHHPAPARCAATCTRPPEVERGPGACCSTARDERVRPGPRRQGPHRVERPDAGRPGRGGAPPPATTDWLDAAAANGRVPAGRPAPRRRPLAALVAGRRRAPATTAPTPPTTRALVDAFTRLAEATGEARWIDEARAAADALLDLFWDDDDGGLFTTGRRRRGAHRPAEGPAGQRHARGQLAGGRRGCSAWPP